MTMTEPQAISPDDLAFIANLSSRVTGLPMILWARECCDAGRDVRIKVNPTHSHRIDCRYLVAVALRPQPHLIAPDDLAPEDRRLVSAWLRLNEAAIVAYREGRIYTDELLQRLQRLE